MLGSVIPGFGTAAGAIAGGGAAALYELYSKIAGTEDIVPLHHLENLMSELIRLNSQSA